MAHVVSGATEVTKFCACLLSTPTTCWENNYRLFFLTLPSEPDMNRQYMLLPVCELTIRRNKAAVGSQKTERE